jgi:hypothetical protein
MLDAQTIQNVLNTHLTILTHERQRYPADLYFRGSLRELETIIEQIGGEIIDGKVILPN